MIGTEKKIKSRNIEILIATVNDGLERDLGTPAKYYIKDNHLGYENEDNVERVDLGEPIDNEGVYEFHYEETENHRYWYGFLTINNEEHSFQLCYE